jgi:hypothetical protein
MQMQRVFIVISIVAACDYYRICSEVVKSDKLDPVVLAQEILSPRLASLGTILSQDPRQAVDRIEGSKTPKPFSNNSVKSPLT